MQASFNLPRQILTDANLTNPNSRQSNVLPLTSGTYTLTLPDVESNKIRIIDSTGKILDEKKFSSSSPQASFHHQSRVADEGNTYSITFLSLNYKNSEMGLFNEHVAESKNFLLSLSPFKENASKLRFNTVEKVLTPEELHCNPWCDGNIATQIVNNAGKPSNAIAVLMYYGGEDKRSYATIAAFVSITNNYKAAVAHELGHIIGALADEYLYPENNPSPPSPTTNCYQGTPPNTRWDTIVPANSYYRECSESTWYRSSETSIMKDIYNPSSLFFNPISRKYLNEGMGFVSEGPGDPVIDCTTISPERTNIVTENLRICQATIQANQGEGGIISVGADNITIDGNDVVLDGGNKSGYGIVLNGHSNVTLKNFTIKNYKYGIFATNSSGIKIENNTVSDNAQASAGGGQYSINVPIDETPGGGILFSQVTNSTVSRNTGSNEGVGINLYNSTGNTISGNNFSNNNAWGIRLYGSSNNTVSSNQANHVNPCTGHCDSAGILLVQGSNSNTISGNNLTYSGDGFFIGNEAGSPSNNNTISGNDGSHSPHNCFEATFSTGNKFSNNTANNCAYGFWLGFSNADLTGNTVSNNTEAGIAWQSGNWDPPGDWRSGNKPGVVSNNILSNNGRGIDMDNGRGVYPVENLSSFPSQNAFNNNRDGNCVGSGFTAADKKGGKCPDGQNGNTPPPTPTPTPPGGGGGGTVNPPAGMPPGYCGGENRTSASFIWADNTKPISCNYADTSYTPGTNNTYNKYCQGKYGNQLAYFYACTAGDGGSGTTIICKDHNGVDGTTYPNGYYAPICLAQAPSQANFKDGLFNSSKASAKPNPYEAGKYYDTYLCLDKSYDFAPREGLANICNKYPWVQDASGTLPPPPGGTTCSDPKPYWDGTKCTYRPDACNNIGPSGKQNTCQATACGAGLDPDTRASKAEANLACVDAYGSSKGYCCLQSSAPAPGDPVNTPTPTITPSSGGGTETENGNCTANPNVCASQFKCVDIGGGNKACKYKNPSEPGAYCNTASNHCSTSSTSCDQTGLVQGDNYACQRAGLGNYCCKGTSSTNPPPPSGDITCSAIQNCTSSQIADSTNRCCTTNPKCRTLLNDSSASCKAVPGTTHGYCLEPGKKIEDYCANSSTYTSSRIASVDTTPTCITNSQCVTVGFKACVFTNNPSVGVCK